MFKLKIWLLLNWKYYFTKNLLLNLGLGCHQSEKLTSLKTSEKLFQILQCSRALICFRVTRIGHNCDAYLLHKELLTIHTISIEPINLQRYKAIDFKQKHFPSKVSFHCRVSTLAECDKSKVCHQQEKRQIKRKI